MLLTPEVVAHTIRSQWIHPRHGMAQHPDCKKIKSDKETTAGKRSVIAHQASVKRIRPQGSEFVHHHSAFI